MYRWTRCGICVLLAIVAVGGNSTNHEPNDTPGEKLEKIEVLTISYKIGRNKSNELGKGGDELGKFTMTKEKRWVFRQVVAEAHSMEGEQLADLDDDEEEEEDRAAGFNDEPEETVIDENDPEERAIHERPIIPQDGNLYPQDCGILYKITTDFEVRKEDMDKAKSSGDPGPCPSSMTLLTSLGILLKIIFN